jgi:GH24 family phage-related lysozyme (muramidase)
MSNRGIIDTARCVAIGLALMAAPEVARAADSGAHAEHVGVSPRPPAAGAAADFFARLKSLAGEWRGESTKGWTDRPSIRTIAGGSVVMSTSFDAHPGETMVTMYHLDGERLLLTHYCVARNQPRLVASEFSPDGRSATFTFLDATGIASRDAGHMDKVVVTIDDARHFTSRWTWFAQGTERWLEEIHHRRLEDSAAAERTDIDSDPP